MNFTDRDLVKRLREGTDGKSINELAAELELAATALDHRLIRLFYLQHMARVMRKQYGRRGSARHGMGKREFERLYREIEICCSSIEL